MTVLDAYAVLAYLRGEPCAHEVADLLRTPTILTAASAVSLADCIAAAAAMTEQCSLATSDPALSSVLRAEGGTITHSPTVMAQALTRTTQMGSCNPRRGKARTSASAAAVAV